MPTVVIANGYDAAALRPSGNAARQLREKLDIGERVFVIGTVSRWHPHKGVGDLLAAVARLRKEQKDTRLLMVGRGLTAENPELRKLIDALGLTDCVTLLGEQEDVAPWAQLFDVHVLSSRTEGFPNAVAETMLCGTPNVATDVGDAGLIVGANGWIVRPGDVQALAEAISEARGEWIEHPIAWGKRQRAARRRIALGYSLERMTTAYEKAWLSLAEQTILLATQTPEGVTSQSVQ